jgi:hypothetical protein
MPAAMKIAKLNALAELGLHVKEENLIPLGDRKEHACSRDPLKRVFCNPSDSAVCVLGAMTSTYTRTPLRVEGEHVVSPLKLRNEGGNGHLCVNYRNPLKEKTTGQQVLRLAVLSYALFVSEKDLADCTDGYTIIHTCENRQCIAPQHLELVPYTKAARKFHEAKIAALSQLESVMDVSYELGEEAIVSEHSQSQGRWVASLGTVATVRSEPSDRQFSSPFCSIPETQLSDEDVPRPSARMASVEAAYPSQAVAPSAEDIPLHDRSGDLFSKFFLV